LQSSDIRATLRAYALTRAVAGGKRAIFAANEMTTATESSGAPSSPGVIHWAARYDFLVSLLTFGRERSFRERLLAPARLEPGESVLDIGCGTGTLAIAAKRKVGASALVCGIDPSSEMIARARRKASRARMDIAFEIAQAESLPFPDARFDVVTSTVMLHHLRRAARVQAVIEARRVLKPGGRLLVVDFVRQAGKGLHAHFHRHGRVDPRDLIALVTDAGMNVIDSGATGQWELQFVVGSRMAHGS
jgi:ubiquinone/menaquinone biosynthesis C-methylase UbiE